MVGRRRRRERVLLLKLLEAEREAWRAELRLRASARRGPSLRVRVGEEVGHRDRLRVRAQLRYVLLDFESALHRGLAGLKFTGEIAETPL